jgi:asparagine synthase (glutamine-hydrolysing)
MPGVFGLACQAPATALPDLLADMAARMAHHPWYADERHADPAGRVALGRVSLGPVNAAAQPAANEDRSLLAVMDGAVYDYAEQRRALEAAGHRFAGAGHAELLAHGYEQGGPAFFCGLHGKFAAALWDANARRLVLVNDRFGMKPLYYARTPGRLLFASALQALLASPAVGRRTDLRGLAQFFTFGQLLGEDTLLEGVRLLPAAGWLVYDADAGRFTLDRYWRLDTRPAARGTAETLDRIDTAFGRAVERCTADTDGLGLSLSGGMDARTILALAARPGRPLTTLSMGMAGGMDHRSAAALSRLAGCPHRQVILGAEFLSRYEEHLRRMVRLTDGQYLCQCIVLPTLPVYRDLGIRVLLRGHAGELMHMTKAYNFSLDRHTLAVGDEAGLMDWLWRRLQAYMLDGTHGRLFAPAHRGAMESLARESLRGCLRETAGTEPPAHRIWQLFLAQRLRRETALSLVEFDSVVETRLPYLDNELIDELFAAPPGLKLGDAIQAHILRRRRPEFLRVVNVNTGTVVGAGPLRRAVSKFRMKVLAKLGVQGYQPYERLGLWLRRELRPLVQGLLLNDRCLGRGVFDPQTVRAVVDDHLDGRRNHTFLVLALMIFETAQRELVDGGAAGAAAPALVGAGAA